MSGRTALTCTECADLAVEVALGVAAGDERQAALDHVDRCVACRKELSLLADVADGVTALTPHAEPPAGFESRVVAALGASPSPSRGRSPSRTRPAVVAVAAAAAALLVAGGWWAGQSLSHSPAPAPAHLTTAALRGGPIQGEAILSTGGHPWLAMAAESTAASGSVTCRVVTSGAGTVTVGTFEVSGGYGYWAAPLPSGAGRVEQAQLLDGPSVVATAHFG